MTKNLLITILVVFLSVHVSAQEETQFLPISSVKTASLPLDSLQLPVLDMQGRPYIAHNWNMWSWGSMGMWQPWQVHKGMNLSLGASVFSTFGSGNTWSGAGFTQDVSALYATRLNSRLSLAVGGYFNNMNWAHRNFRDVGLTATLGYDINDRMTAYLYAQKSLYCNYPLPFYAYDLGNMGDRIGVAFEYKVTPALTIGASFDVSRSAYESSQSDRRPHPRDVHDRVLNPLNR